MSDEISDGKKMFQGTRDELIARLKLFPADNDFQLHDDTHFVQWCNGHCFYWVRKSEGWDCDEL